MALGKAKATALFPIALAIIACSAVCGPASAQVFWGDRPSGSWGRSDGWGWGNRYPSDRYYRRSPYRDFFGERHTRPTPTVDNSKAPAPRKLETPPSRTVVVIGDSMADWLGYGLDESYAEQPDVGVERKIRATSGLVHYDAKNETLDWPQAAKDALSNEKLNAIVVMLGLNDKVPLRDKAPAQPNRNGELVQGANQSASKVSQDKVAAPAGAKAPSQTSAQSEAQKPVPGASYDFHTDQWAGLYAERVDAMIAALKSKGVPVIWVGLPAIRGTKATSDISYLNELYRERAERAGITYVDIWDGFVDEDGDYVMQGPDFEGQTRRLRTADGVYFTKAGAIKLASCVDRELRRVMPSYVAPVALSSPETTPKSGSATARPDIGPVLPLTIGGGDKGGELLGGADHPPQATSDSIATRVLSRGETLAAPTGRADDFSWPRLENDGSTRPEESADPVAAPLDPAEEQGAAVKRDDKNQADTKKDAKEKLANDSHASAQAGPHRYYNYYPGQHSRWYREHHYGWYHRW